MAAAFEAAGAKPSSNATVDQALADQVRGEGEAGQIEKRWAAAEPGWRLRTRQPRLKVIACRCTRPPTRLSPTTPSVKHRRRET